MTKIVVKWEFVLMAMGLLTACNDGNTIDIIEEGTDSMVVDMLPKTQPIILTAEQRTFAQKNNDFTFNLYRAINETDNKKSNVTSPLSATFLMGMLNDGAAGITTQEISKVLGFGNDKEALNVYCKALMEQAPKADPSVILQIANIVAANKQVSLEAAFNKDMLDYYQAEVASLDFAKSSSVDYLNSWCNEKSNGMIPQIIDQLNPNALLVLMNALYFKATWTEKFDEKDTQTESFAKADGTTLQLPMMHRNAEMLYAKNELYSNICLPFGSGDKYSMHILLPNDGKTVDDVINSLSNSTWERSKAYFHTIADIKIPRFFTESDIVLNNMVAKLGAPSIFDPQKADFSGISKNFKQLYVNLLKQKTAIEVSEEGTKTTAITVADWVGADMSKKKKVEFHANRPFVYVIQEASSGAIFFIGTFRGE